MLRSSVAIVTGAGRGIGKGIALSLADKGANVAICDIDLETAEQVAEEIESKGSKALALRVDVSEAAEVRKFVRAVVREFGHIDTLINNVGINPLLSASEMTPEQWDEIIDVNLRSHFLFSQGYGFGCSFW